MNILRSCVLMELLVPVVCADSDPTVCYILDGLLMVYCTVVTAFLVQAKMSKTPETPELSEEDVYQKLNAVDADPYEELKVSAKNEGKKSAKDK